MDPGAPMDPWAHMDPWALWTLGPLDLGAQGTQGRAMGPWARDLDIRILVNGVLEINLKG